MSFLDGCRIIQFQEEIHNMILTNHVVQSHRVANQEICKIHCYLETKCVSYNYGRLHDGSFLCEINDKHHLQVPSNEFMARDGFIFSPILVSRGTIYRTHCKIFCIKSMILKAHWSPYFLENNCYFKSIFALNCK